MPKLYFYFIITTIFIPLISMGQNEDNIWIFGRGHGLNFNTTPPMPFKSKITTYESSASVCDKNGNLLFYSNGNKVRDKYERVMPNGYDIEGNYFNYDTGSGGSATQGVGIMGFITDPDRYYLFTLDAEENGFDGGSRYLRYSVINMQLNDGFGDVEQDYKNIVLDSFMSEKMVFTQGDGCFNWLVVHSIDSPVFHSFKISADGISGPVSSRAGEGRDFSAGEMKISQDGDKLAFANCRSTTSLKSVSIYNFDNRTGKVSDYYQIDTFPEFHYPYGLSFSPNGKYLFITLINAGELVQYDLSFLPDIEKVRMNKYTRFAKDSTTVNLCAMRIGPDNKIYIARIAYDHLSLYPRNTIAVINNPDLKGADIDLVEFAIDLPVDTSGDFKYLGIGSPACVKGRVERFEHHKFISCDTIDVDVDASLNDALHTWDNGDTTVHRRLIAPALVWVRTESKNLCRVDTYSVVKDEFSFDLGKDISGICEGEVIHLKPGIGQANYTWYNGSTANELSVSHSGKYWVQVERNNCMVSDTIHIDAKPCDNCISIPNAFTPNGDNLNDYFKPIFRCRVLKYRLLIVNRYGQEVFSTDSPLSYWDGQFNAMPEMMSVYYYMINVKFDTPQQEMQMYKGDVLLIR